MNEKLTNFKDQTVKVWTDMSVTKRVISVSMLAAVGIMAFWLMTRTKHVDYAYLFTDLDAQSGARIIEELKEKKIPYQVKSGGTAVMVPRDKVYELRMIMAGKGLTLGGTATGFEIFDKSQFGVTDFVQKLNYRRALEGELARTISSLQSVTGARVHLVIPERKLFKDEHEDASASVVLNVVSGRSLNQKNIDGIRNLVAGSVPGLKPAHVHIVNSNGETIGDTDSEKTEKMTMINLQKRLEKDYEIKIRNMLEDILGKGKAVVRVSLDMDFTKKSSVSEKYNPDGQVARSEKKHVERRGNIANFTAGIPGARSNLPGGQQPRGNGAGNGAETVKSLTNYEIDKVVTKTVDPVGTRKRISVAVVVDGMYAGKGAARTFKPLPKEKLASISELVKKAVGFRSQDGDQVEIQSYELSKPEVKPVVAPSKRSYVKYIPYAVGAGTGFIVLLMLIFMYLMPKYKVWKQMKVREAAILSEIQDNRFKPTPIRVIEEKLEAPAVEGQRILLNSAKEEDQMTPAESQRDQVLSFVESDPDRTVAILKNWITSEA